jgi:hypothetical protein
MRGIPETATAVNLLEFIDDILILVKSQASSKVPNVDAEASATTLSVALLPKQRLVYRLRFHQFCFINIKL